MRAHFSVYCLILWLITGAQNNELTSAQHSSWAANWSLTATSEAQGIILQSYNIQFCMKFKTVKPALRCVFRPVFIPSRILISVFFITVHFVNLVWNWFVFVIFINWFAHFLLIKIMIYYKLYILDSQICMDKFV